MTPHPEITAYRPCVGVMLVNREGLVWIGRRFEKQNDEISLPMFKPAGK